MHTHRRIYAIYFYVSVYVWDRERVEIRKKKREWTRYWEYFSLRWMFRGLYSHSMHSKITPHRWHHCATRPRIFPHPTPSGRAPPSKKECWIRQRGKIARYQTHITRRRLPNVAVVWRKSWTHLVFRGGYSVIVCWGFHTVVRKIKKKTKQRIVSNTVSLH